MIGLVYFMARALAFYGAFSAPAEEEIVLAAPAVEETVTVRVDRRHATAEQISVVKQKPAEKPKSAKKPQPQNPTTKKVVPHRGVSTFDTSILPSVTRIYNRDRLGEEASVRKCLRKRAVIEKAAKISGYPLAFALGIITHESHGCKQLSQGLMQISLAPDQAKAVAARKLGQDEVDATASDLENIVIGLETLRVYETSFQSRELGLKAYNKGPARIRKDESQGTRYVTEVLSAVVVADRVLRGEKVQPDKKITAGEIPGW
ncbi:MAG: transglycosylase SLT domain-containing protein [Patescibacteria group bacterium]